ncbi:hypothetical protein MTQ13_20710, partial [Streptomyces sp. XM4011]|nr:hypothetical protein [Streptomyces sp. XM4011]
MTAPRKTAEKTAEKPAEREIPAPEPDLLDTAPHPQPGLRAYLEVKRAALLARRAACPLYTSPSPRDRS